MLDGTQTLGDIFNEFANGKFAQGSPINDNYQKLLISVVQVHIYLVLVQYVQAHSTAECATVAVDGAVSGI